MIVKKDIHFQAVLMKKEELLLKEKHRLNVSRMLKLLGVSRNGFHAFLHHKTSEQENGKRYVKRK